MDPDFLSRFVEQEVVPSFEDLDRFYFNEIEKCPLKASFCSKVFEHGGF
jgi:hypothetical protein